jgi:hypothetical protein
MKSSTRPGYRSPIYRVRDGEMGRDGIANVWRREEREERKEEEITCLLLSIPFLLFVSLSLSFVRFHTHTHTHTHTVLSLIPSSPQYKQIISISIETERGGGIPG